MKALLCLILLTGMISLTAPDQAKAETSVSEDNVCTGTFVNPITDICWDCIFPISIGPVSIFTDRPDPPNPGNILCACPIAIPPFVRIGISIGFWEPARLL